MGLDMYLIKKTYVKNWDHMKPEERHTVKVTGPRAGDIDPNRVSYIEEEAGYWRKANCIHKWFVDNVQLGADDCGEYYVTQSDLQTLLDTVNKVLESSKLIDGTVTNGWTMDGPILEPGKVLVDPSVAEELLPSQEGFFFGNTDYDQYYIEDLVLTKNILEAALSEGGDFYYHSSW